MRYRSVVYSLGLLACVFASSVRAEPAKPVDFAQFRETVQQLGLYWLVKNESPPPRAFSAEPGP